MKVTYLHEFVDAFLALDKPVRKQLKKKLDEFARADLEHYPHQALQGPEFKGIYKLRVGDWRLLYKVLEEEVEFVGLGHRSGVYE